MLENTLLLSISFVILTIVVAIWINSTIKIGRYQWFVIFIWMVLLSALSLTDFFKVYDSIPPRLTLVMIPLLMFSFLFPFTSSGKKMVSSANIKKLTLIHSIRILVELLFLYQLYCLGYVSEIVTFDGRNFDIIPALSAPIIWWIGFKKKWIGKKVLVAWNLLSLATIFFTISQGLLSAPLPFQQFGFDQPTIAIFYFPFILLPGFVAPVMIFSHIISIHHLIRKSL